MSIQDTTEDIAIQMSADTSRENLRRCLQRIRDNQKALTEARAQMDQAIYDLTRAREFAEAMEETNRDLEARVYLLMGAFDV